MSSSLDKAPLGLSNKSSDLIDLKIIYGICELSYLGMRVLKRIPGSKVVGELLDEPSEEIKIEVKEYLYKFLQK